MPWMLDKNFIDTEIWQLLMKKKEQIIKQHTQHDLILAETHILHAYTHTHQRPEKKKTIAFIFLVVFTKVLQLIS